MEAAPHRTPDVRAPVFIAGVARSGTSILYRTLQAHPRFRPSRAPDGFDLTESRAFAEPWSVRLRDAAPFRFLLEDEASHRRLLAAAAALPSLGARLHRVERLRHLANRTRATRAAWWRICGNERLLRLYFREAAAARGATRLVEKTPAHVWSLPEIRTTFPDAKVVCLHRHPLSVFASYRRRLAIAERDLTTSAATRAWLRPSADVFTEGYRRELAAIGRGIDDAPGAVLAVRYEALTREPEKELRRVLDFLGEPFDESCLHADTPSLAAWEQDPLLSRPVGANDADWRTNVDPPTARTIEDRLADVLARWGHSPLVDGAGGAP